MKWQGKIGTAVSCGRDSSGNEMRDYFTVITLPIDETTVIDVDTLFHSDNAYEHISPELFAWADTVVWTDSGAQFVRLDKGRFSEILWKRYQDQNYVKCSIERKSWSMRTHSKRNDFKRREMHALTRRGVDFAYLWNWEAERAAGNHVPDKVLEMKALPKLEAPGCGES